MNQDEKIERALRRSRNGAIVAFVLAIVALGLAFASLAQAASSYLHQGEAYVFQTAATFDLQDQGHYGLVKVRPCDRLDSRTVRCGITGHKAFTYGRHTVRQDCRWSVTVSKARTARGTVTRSSGASGVCVEAPGQR